MKCISDIFFRYFSVERASIIVKEGLQVSHLQVCWGPRDVSLSEGAQASPLSDWAQKTSNTSVHMWKGSGADSSHVAAVLIQLGS